MKKKSVWALALAAMLMWVGKPAVAAVNEAFDPVEYVNPLMGTQSSFELSTGNTYPAGRGSARVRDDSNRRGEGG